MNIEIPSDAGMFDPGSLRLSWKEGSYKAITNV
jgi:hypothetical protein